MIFKKQLKHLASLLVLWQAKRIYAKAVKAADKKHKDEGCAVYVVEYPPESRRLMALSGKEYRILRSYYKRGGTVMHLKCRCFYHTKDRMGNDALSAKRIEVRRLAFSRMLLSRAKLL